MWGVQGYCKVEGKEQEVVGPGVVLYFKCITLCIFPTSQTHSHFDYLYSIHGVTQEGSPQAAQGFPAASGRRI